MKCSSGSLWQQITERQPFAEERIKKACELALLTDKEQEEVSKDLDKKIDEKLDKLANAILKELFEGGSNDGQ